MGTELRAGLVGIKAKALSGVRLRSRLGQVRVGLDGLRKNPYPGVVGSDGLG
jgi:hypothetical protein